MERQNTIAGEPSSPKTDVLLKRLQDNNAYTNAEMLLMEHYGMKSRQIEDEDMYHAVKTITRLLAEKSISEYETIYVISSIAYLQARRTAAMLQNIPDVINDEFACGRIKSKKAIFTVGLSHISDIIKYLKKGRIDIQSPAFHSSYNDFFSELNIQREQYGVTIIIPNTLAESRDVARLTGIDLLM